MQSKQFPKFELTMEVGGWGEVSRGKKCIEKSSQNSPMPVLISVTVCIHC